MEANLVAAHSLQQGEGAHQVGLNEGRGIEEGVVVMRLGGKVHNRVSVGDDTIDKVRISDVTLNDGQAGSELGGHVGQGCAVARVGELIQDDDIDVRMILQQRVNEIRSDEASTAGHNDLHKVFSFARPWASEGVTHPIPAPIMP